MFRGDKINVTEKRAVLDVALRAHEQQSIVLDVFLQKSAFQRGALKCSLGCAQ